MRVGTNLLIRAGQALYGAGFVPSLADALDVNERTVQRWASGQAYPPRGVWIELVSLLGEQPLAGEISRLTTEQHRR
jgi:hypothetical protein